MVASPQIKLPRPPTKTELILYKIARLLFWIGLYTLTLFLLMNSGIGTTLTLTIQTLDTFNNSTGYISANSTFFPTNVELDGQTLGQTPVQNYAVPQGNYLLTFSPPYSDLMELSVPISVYANSISIAKAQVGPYITSSSYIVIYTYPSKGTNLIVYSAPIRAKIYEDNELIGQTPLVIGSIAPKTTAIRVEYPGYEPQTIEINLVANSTTVLNANLYKKILDLK